MTYLPKHMVREENDINIKIFNMITRINEIKALVKSLIQVKKLIWYKNEAKINVTVRHAFVKIAGI